jgi:quercetin dioxygenase-like cupin family protein
MKGTIMIKISSGLRIFELAVFLAIAVAIPVGPAANAEGDQVRPVRAEKLPNVPGKSLTAVVVNYAPGGKSVKHHHAGSVFAYVLSGEIRSENSLTGAAKVYKVGESFFGPPRSEHLVSENASATEPASLLAVFVADDGAQLTNFDK